MRQLLDVFVPGHPRTKGSLDFKGAGRVVENVAGSTTWRKLMAQAVGQAWRTPDGKTRDARPGPIRVSATFYLPCARGPRSLIAARSGDVDKLTRNLLDALAVDETGKGLGAGVFANDAQVVGIVVDKRQARDAEPQGVRILVWEEP
jgi:Holliday junction resolvase RusA-like endonuclease